ncbi:hypothetical protein [Pseudomonas akapageensis]|uniref:hypothetical protein n=1 Tax=Pseudomonas akapageensis TaxID=2609961 RepID=UPI00140BF30A|nr:hypothetical protein [Pseudomonas akapageensis]
MKISLELTALMMRDFALPSAMPFFTPKQYSFAVWWNDFATTLLIKQSEVAFQ